MCLPISPDNPHYGINGDYQDFLHYPHAEPPPGKEIVLGACSKENLDRWVIQRLRYNPDFEGMMEKLLGFLM